MKKIILVIASLMILSACSDYGNVSSPDYGVFKVNGPSHILSGIESHVITFHGYYDNMAPCIEIIKTYNEYNEHISNDATYQCRALEEK